MNNVLSKQKIAENTFAIEVENPELARKLGPAQFVLVRPKSGFSSLCVPVGEIKKNSFSFIAKGESTKFFSSLKKNDELNDVIGPIGNRTALEEIEQVCLICDSHGIPMMYNLAKFYKDNKIRSSIVVTDKTKKMLYWEDKLKTIADILLICTDDGSKGEKGPVYPHLRDLLGHMQYDIAIVSGSPLFMHEVANFTRQRIKTRAIVNPKMLDPIGLSGTCRIKVDDKIKFATIDGPTFNAHSIDFDELQQRIGKEFE